MVQRVLKVQKRVPYVPSCATRLLGYCLRLRPFRHIDFSFFPSGSGGPLALRIVSRPAVLPKKRTTMVLALPRPYRLRISR